MFQPLLPNSLLPQIRVVPCLRLSLLSPSALFFVRGGLDFFFFFPPPSPVPCISTSFPRPPPFTDVLSLSTGSTFLFPWKYLIKATNSLPFFPPQTPFYPPTHPTPSSSVCTQTAAFSHDLFSVSMFDDCVFSLTPHLCRNPSGPLRYPLYRVLVLCLPPVSCPPFIRNGYDIGCYPPFSPSMKGAHLSPPRNPPGFHPTTVLSYSPLPPSLNSFLTEFFSFSFHTFSYARRIIVSFLFRRSLECSAVSSLPKYSSFFLNVITGPLFSFLFPSPLDEFPIPCQNPADHYLLYFLKMEM